MNISVDLLTVAKRLTNYKKDATGGGLWTDTTHYVATCPTGKRWFLYGGCVNRDVNGTVAIWLKDASDNVLLQMTAYAAGTGINPWPTSTYVAEVVFPFIIDAGEYIEMIFGAVQDTAAYASCVVLEIDI